MALRRRTTDEPTVDVVETTPPPSGKGRPTPKRSEARQARRTAVAPKNRKEAAARLRERNREERRKQRAALVSGDERNLPPRDAGPAKRLARDVVDSRFSYGQVFFGVIIVVILLTFINNDVVRLVTNFAALASLAIMVVDGVRHGRAAKRAVAERFGEKEALGITTYALTRSMLPRRMRKPPPKVERGAQV